MIDSCRQQCSCVAGELMCEPVSCDSYAHCLIKAGVKQCYCDEGFEGDGIQCAPVGETAKFRKDWTILPQYEV